MSDVERICEMNHERVRWAEEYTAGAGNNPSGGRPLAAPTGCGHMTALPSEKVQKKRRALRTASLFCAMMCGVSVSCMVRGMVNLDMQTLVPGVIGAVVFLSSGWLMDEKVEELSV